MRGCERTLLGIGLTVGLVLEASVSVSFAAERPNFSGTWTRDTELSQDWEARVDAAIRPDTDRNDDPSKLKFVKRLRELLRGADEVEIRHTEGEIQVESGADEVRIFYLGREHVRQNKAGLKIQATCRWLGDDFILEEVTEDGSRITERLTRLGSGDQLAHLLRWEHEALRDPLIIRSVYERVKEQTRVDSVRARDLR